MKTTKNFSGPTQKMYILYGMLYTAAFSWPWIWMAATGSAGEGDLVDLIGLGMFPALILSVFILYRDAKSLSSLYKWAFSTVFLAVFLIGWIMGAVGIFGRSGDPADLIYYGIIALGIVGALLSRFQARGMGYTLLLMAISQVLVEIYGIISGWGSRITINGFFAALWLTSALLFHKAAQKENETETNNL